MRTEDQIEVMKAWLSGKQVERFNGEVWVPLGKPDHVVLEPQWNWEHYEYRITPPPPMEIEIWVSPDGRVIEYNAMEPGWKKKKFREVIE